MVKEYPQKQNISVEEQLRNSFSELSKEVMDLTMGVFKIVEDRNRIALRRDIDSIAFDVVPDTVYDVVRVFNLVINKIIEEKKIDVAKLKNIGNEFGQLFNKIFKERFDEAVKKHDLVTERTLKNVL